MRRFWLCCRTPQPRLPVSPGTRRLQLLRARFIYTSCALPNFCFRNSNTFGVLQKRFKEQMGRDLVLLTVTFDPQRDQPDVLARYAKTWKANPATWHFLTGPIPSVERVSNMFGMDYFPDEGLMDHSLHAAIINRRGRLVANIEGNQFSADQLGDLVQTVLISSAPASRSTPQTRTINPRKPIKNQKNQSALRQLNIFHVQKPPDWASL